MRFARLLGVIAVLLVMIPAAAQDTPPSDSVTNALISFGETVTDTITEESIFDLWSFYGVEGQTIIVRMVASNGLAPLIGILDTTRTLSARSDTTEDGTQVDALPNGVAFLRYTLPATGEYTINATRVGNFDGTTTGRYTLTLEIEAFEPPSNPYQEVTFLCGASEITTIATLELAEDPDFADTYRITLIGLDGFQPVLRYTFANAPETDFCSASQDEHPVLDGTLTLPEGETLNVTNDNAIQAIMRGMRSAGLVTLTVGSEDGSAGRYVLLVEGFSIQPRNDADILTVRLGPLARESEMLIYMTRPEATRIDPFVSVYDAVTDASVSCDDVGRRGCETIPAIQGLEIAINEEIHIAGGRFDAGGRVATGDLEPLQVGFASRAASATGEYAIVIFGELPARDAE